SAEACANPPGVIGSTLLVFNEEFLVSASHQLALTTSLSFVHTALHSYQLNDPMKYLDRGNGGNSLHAMSREANLRNDHCQNMQKRTTREHILNTWGRRVPVMHLLSITRNPVNHRVFDRKLHPKPLSQG
ncbi:hypothetical protein H5410_039388, partial [Solanum commersonii]